jgi:hypothetical protein
MLLISCSCGNIKIEHKKDLCRKDKKQERISNKEPLISTFQKTKPSGRILRKTGL